MTQEEIINKNRRDIELAGHKDWLTQADIDGLHGYPVPPPEKPGMFQSWGEAIKTLGIGLTVCIFCLAGYYIVFQAVKLAWQYWR